MTLALFASFVALGACGTLLGPSFQSLTQRFNMPLENAGIFTSLQFSGVIVGASLFGWLMDRISARYLMLIGLALIGGALLFIGAAPSLPIALIAVLLLGLGMGALDVAPNVVIASLYPEGAAAALNTLNLYFSLGAMIGPQLLNFALQQHNFTLAFTITGTSTLLLLIPFSLIPVNVRLTDKSSARSTLHWTAFLPFAVIMFAYVGAEIGFSSWVFTQLTKVTLSTAAVGTIAVSLFWIGLTVSRGVAGLMLRRLSNEQLIVMSAGVLGTGVLLMLILPTSEIVSLVSAFIVGFGCGPIFPTLYAIVTSHYPGARGTVSGIMTVLGSFGAATLPWLQGQIGGGRSGGMIVVLASALLILTVAVTLQRQERYARALSESTDRSHIS